jgi:hypothetical protein
MKLIKALLIVVTLAPAISLACAFDTECSPGSQCVKGQGQLYGVCTGGLSPGNKNDQQPVYAPLDINRTYGNTCTYDTECGPGSKCAKQNGSLQGVCVR